MMRMQQIHNLCARVCIW